RFLLTTTSTAPLYLLSLHDALPILPRSTPDFAALEVLNAALGGLFSSRINLNLREAHGYTYGAWSAFIYRHRSPGPFWIRAGVRDRKSTRLNSSHVSISYAVFCLKK